MKIRWEDSEKKLSEIKNIKIRIENVNHHPSDYYHPELSNDGLKIDKKYYCVIELDKFEFDLELYEKNGVIFHDEWIVHPYQNHFICPLCLKATERSYTCEAIKNHLSEFFSFIITKHPSTRVRFITDPIFQGKEILSPMKAFENFSNIKFKEMQN